jgi:hypothetical protein
VRKTLAGFARTYGRPKKKAGALPIRDLERIVARLATLGTLKAARDDPLLQIGVWGECAGASWLGSGSGTPAGRGHRDRPAALEGGPAGRRHRRGGPVQGRFLLPAWENCQ